MLPACGWCAAGARGGRVGGTIPPGCQLCPLCAKLPTSFHAALFPLGHIVCNLHPKESNPRYSHTHSVLEETDCAAEQCPGTAICCWWQLLDSSVLRTAVRSIPSSEAIKPFLQALLLAGARCCSTCGLGTLHPHNNTAGQFLHLALHMF